MRPVANRDAVVWDEGEMNHAPNDPDAASPDRTILKNARISPAMNSGASNAAK